MPKTNKIDTHKNPLANYNLPIQSEARPFHTVAKDLHSRITKRRKLAHSRVYWIAHIRCRCTTYDDVQVVEKNTLNSRISVLIYVKQHQPSQRHCSVFSTITSCFHKAFSSWSLTVCLSLAAEDWRQLRRSGVAPGRFALELADLWDIISGDNQEANHHLASRARSARSTTPRFSQIARATGSAKSKHKVLTIIQNRRIHNIRRYY